MRSSSSHKVVPSSSNGPSGTEKKPESVGSPRKSVGSPGQTVLRMLRPVPVVQGNGFMKHTKQAAYQDSPTNRVPRTSVDSPKTPFSANTLLENASNLVGLRVVRTSQEFQAIPRSGRTSQDSIGLLPPRVNRTSQDSITMSGLGPRAERNSKDDAPPSPGTVDDLIGFEDRVPPMNRGHGRASPPDQAALVRSHPGRLSPDHSTHHTTVEDRHVHDGSLKSPLEMNAAQDAIESVKRAEKFQEQRRADKAKADWWMLHPHERFRQNWDVATMLIIAYSAMAIPFDVAYTPEDHVHDEWFVAFSWAIDVFFWIDIVLNFRTGIEDHDHHLHFGQMDIFKSYMKGWFWIDFLSAFPYDFLINDEEGRDGLPKMLRVLRLSKLIRLIRLVRIGRVMRVLQRLEYSIPMQEGARQLAGFSVLLITITHWFSCLFYTLGEFDMMEVDGGKCWANGHNLCSDDIFTNYVAACYWAIMTLSTVGYGDVGAINNHQRILGIVAMICGALIFAYGVSQVVNIVEDMRAEAKSFKTRMDKFNAYMAQRTLPQDLRGDIREFLHNIRRRQKSTIKDEDYLLAQLSMGLRSRIAMAINEKYVKEMPFFLGCDTELTMELALRMESFYYAAYEDVVRTGEEGDEMFFIVAGACEVLIGEEPAQTRVAVLVEKQFFGESALLMPEGQRRRNATVRCLQFCEFRSLSTEHFLDILTRFPGAMEAIQKISNSRQQAIQKNIIREKKSPKVLPDSPKNKNDLDSPATAHTPASNKLVSTLKEIGPPTLMNSLAILTPETQVGRHTSTKSGTGGAKAESSVPASPHGASASPSGWRTSSMDGSNTPSGSNTSSRRRMSQTPPVSESIKKAESIKSDAMVGRSIPWKDDIISRLQTMEGVMADHMADTTRRLVEIQEHMLNISKPVETLSPEVAVEAATSLGSPAFLRPILPKISLFGDGVEEKEAEKAQNMKYEI